MTMHLSRALGAALIGLAALATPANADIKDYQFQLLDPTVTTGRDRIVTVKLINKATGQAVPDAVIFATRLDMAPDGMAEMTTKIALEPGAAAPGLYRFKATFGMDGRWLLSIGAKVQGETGSVEAKLVITSTK